MTKEFSFRSDMARGIIYYELPSLKQLLGQTAAQQMTSYNPVIFLLGSTNSDGTRNSYSCTTSSNCQVNYSIAYTPQVNRIYPSTVYAGQDLCFNVFTDAASNGGKSILSSAKVGEYTMDISTYETANLAAVSNWNYYQICGTAGGNIAASSYDLTLTSEVGKYLVTNFAKSFDGTSEYVIRSVPKVTGVSANTLYKAAGTILSISGEGFDPSPANNKVKVDDLDCTVFEASTRELKCTLPEKTTVTTGTEFVGGLGAHVKEYIGKVNSELTTADTDKTARGTCPYSFSSSTQTSICRHMTDIESRRNTDDGSKFTRTVEAWFVPPQTGSYIFHASCDDSCSVFLSTTDMSTSTATEIIKGATYNGWRNFWRLPTSSSSTAQTLTAGKHYYLKVIHNEYGGDDYMTVGFTIDDASTARPNSQKGWKLLSINPNHTFEKFTISLPKSTTASFRAQFKNTAKNCAALTSATDIFKCSTTTCPCVSSSFKATSSEGEVRSALASFFNSIQSNYGSSLEVKKETLDAAGAVTAVTADIATYKFTLTGRYALSAASTTEIKIFSDDATVTTATATKDSESTLPLTGKYKLRIPQNTAGDKKDTEDIGLDWYDGHILRQIYAAVPDYIGRVEVKTDTSNFISHKEGREIYYRISGTSYGDFEIASSSTEALAGGSTTQPIGLTANNNYIPASNKPFYEVIPGSMVRTVEPKAQIIVTSNNLAGACPVAGACDVTFINNVAEITTRTAAADFSSLTFVGTAIPTADLTYVSLGTVRRCEIDTTTAPTATGLKCNLLKPISGSHNVVVQTKKGAISNKSTVVALDIPVKITNVQPTTLGTSGGQTVTILGDYFPQSLTEAQSFTDFSVKFTGGASCSVTSVSQTEIKCTTPAGLSGTPKITVTFNGKNLEYATAFTISTVTNSVTAINKSAVSPVEKQDLVITLSSTPTNAPNDYRGVLISADRTLYMKINSVDTTAKTVTARFPGSPKGDEYTVFVEHSGQRFSSNVKLNAKAEITAIAITTPSTPAKTTIGTTGGDLVKLTGTGFSTNLSDNIVVFGSNIKTDIVSATVTELVVRAKASSTAGAAEVTAFLKPNIEVKCLIGGGCKVTYAEDTALKLNNSGVELTHNNGVITISGSGFGANAKGYIGDYLQTTVSSTATEVQLKITKLDDNENFDLEVRTDTVNLPKVFVKKPFEPALLSVSPNAGSLGGEKITLTTVGLGLKTTRNLNIYYGSGSTAVSVCTDGTIQLVDSSTVTCITKEGLAITKNSLRLSYTQVSTLSGTQTVKYLSCTVATNCDYETSTTATPTIASVAKLNTNTKLSVTVNNFSFDSTYTIKLHYGKQVATADSITSPTVTGAFPSGFAPGVANVRVSFEKGNRITYTSKYEETVALAATMGSTVNCSWAGGCKVTITQAGLKAGAEAGDVTVEVCGSVATPRISDSSTNELVVWAPSYVSSHSLENFKVEEAQKITGTVTSLPADQGLLAFDGVTSTQYKSVSDSKCFVQVKFSDGKVGRVQKVRYFMSRMTDKQTNFVNKLKFQSSTDGTTWTDVFAADTYLREGWNEHKPAATLKTQYYRFYSETKEACQIAEIELWGNIVEDSSATTKTCDVVVKAAGSQTQTFAGKVTYQDSASAVVTGIAPRYGTYKGGQKVTFTGTGFSTTTSEISVTIDGIPCAVDTATATKIECTTGARPTVNANPSTVLTFTGTGKNGHASMQKLGYKYANYWSDLDTWSGEYIPQTGDSVVIPKGQTLVVDVDSTPLIKAVIVQGALVFAPDANPNHHRQFDAEYVFVSEGAVFEAGTETDRYTSKLTITMHGTRESPEVPIYGNKGIFVRKGQLDIHGVVRDYTWTELATTVNAGSNLVPLNVKVDWKAGERIVLAPTDFEADHAEEFEIISVDNTGTKTILTVDRPAIYKHYAGSKDYTGTNANGSKTKTLEMRGEVGLLTRNVVYKGADHDSVEKMYGAHIMLHSSGDDSLTGRISYAEFKQVGQAFQLGRYPIHFHMIGAVHNSYIKGNAIHHTYNRACTVHGVHYLTIENNVAYETMGHTFFIEDGAETKNLLKNNLAIKTKTSWSLLNTDQTPASFWITHPDNQFIGNHAAGSDRYGFWFDLQTNPTGPSFDPNICPEFEQLGEFTGNVAHSNGRYGLRIFHRFTPVTNPCAALAGGAHSKREQPDPTISVPIVTHFRDFLGYKNKRTAIIAEELGALKFHNVRAADNLFSGVEFGLTAAGPWLTSADDYHLQDALIVAASDNAEDDVQKNHADVETTRGIKGARTEKMRIKDTIFANFNYDSRWGAIGTCSHCEGPATDSSGRTYFFKNLYFIDTTQRVKFDIPFKEIIYDEDGTLGSATHRWIVFYFKHLDVPECIRKEAEYNGLLCSDSISIRRIVFHDPKPFNALKGLPMKILNTNKIVSARRMLAGADVCSAVTTKNAVAALNSVDTAALALQKELLLNYDTYSTNEVKYKEAVKLAEATGSTAQATLIAQYKSNMDAAKLKIDELKPKVEAEQGKYDNLYKTDNNFCNTDNYAEIEFRPKANPMQNWVFNVITGYEYKVHIKQGADFESLAGQYSYPELIKNDGDKGTILHFNHTERAEAFVFEYTDSTTKKSAEVTGKETQLQYSDSTLQMGDFHMNNVTRHLTVKFDSKASDRTIFTLTRKECITVGGCNGKLPNEGEIETTPRYWSDKNSWTKKELPKANEEVVIDSTWNMILDVKDLPVFKSIEINGRLTIKNDGSDYNVRAYLIYVRKGELIVGTQESPFTGTVTFTLYGERADKDIYFHDKMFEGGNKVIANTGKLRMYGKPVGTKWTRLAAKATAGSNKIELVDTPTDWKVGDNIGIAPSGRDYTHRDFGTISAISGKTITLSSPLVYEHYGAASVDSTKTGGIDIRAEVLHLSRNIKVQGENKDRWGAHVVSAHNKDSGFVDGKLVTIERKGSMILDHVEFVNCSQYDTDKAAVRFASYFALTEADEKSSVTNSAIYNGLGIGIMVTSANDITVENNVVFFQHIGGIWMKASHNTKIIGNVVAGMGTRYWSNETKLDEIAAFNFCNKDQNCKNLQVKNNIAAGGERVGFAIPTLDCASLSNYENNLAHTFQHGAWVFKNLLLKDKECFGNFKAYKTVEQGVLAYQDYKSLKVSNIETLDCGRGVSLMLGKNQDFNSIEFADSIIWGESEDLPKDSGSMCISIYGYWLSAATQGGKIFPEVKLSNLPYEKFKTYSNWFTEATVSNVSFRNWKSSTRKFCSTTSTKQQKTLFINPDNSDHVPVNTFINVKFEEVAHDAVAQLDDPNPAWANIDDCGQFPCTAPKNAVLKFEGATATGSLTPTVNGISAGATFQIIPNNPTAATNIKTCTAVPTWNAYLCYNPKIAQIMFESLDDDKEDRTVSPIHILGITDKFNNTLNSFMDHCWDGHYTCQKRLSRFPGLVETDRNYEIYYTGTAPGKTRYVLEGAKDGDWLQVKIDFSKSILYYVYADNKLIESTRYDGTEKKIPQLKKSHCGENRFEQITYEYEFYLTKGCTVRLEAQEHMLGLARLQMTLDQFFADDFVNKLAFALGISTNQIRIVSVRQGSVIVYWQLTSSASAQTDQRRNLIELADMLAAKHAAGTLDLGAPILDLVTQIITSGGTEVTTGTSTYKKKEIHVSVYILLAISGVAVLVALGFGLFKVLKMSKVYKEVSNLEKEPGVDVGEDKSELENKIGDKANNGVFEEYKS